MNRTFWLFSVVFSLVISLFHSSQASESLPHFQSFGFQVDLDTRRGQYDQAPQLFKTGGKFTFSAHKLMPHNHLLFMSLAHPLRKYYVRALIQSEDDFIKTNPYYKDTINASFEEKNIECNLFSPQTFVENVKYPLIIYIPGTAGIREETEKAMARFLTAQTYGTKKKIPGAYVALFDSNRGLHGEGVLGKISANQNSINAFEPTLAAYRCALALRDHPNIDKENVFILGSSRGAIASWGALHYPFKYEMSEPDFMFKGHIALSLSPVVIPRKFYLTGAPLLMIHGQEDDFCRPEYVDLLSQILKKKDYPVEHVTLEKAGHYFECQHYPKDDQGKLIIPEEREKIHLTPTEDGRISIKLAHKPENICLLLDDFFDFFVHKPLTPFQTEPKSFEDKDWIKALTERYGSVSFLKDHWDAETKEWKASIWKLINNANYLKPQDPQEIPEKEELKIFDFLTAQKKMNTPPLPRGAHLQPNEEAREKTQQTMVRFMGKLVDQDD